MNFIFSDLEGSNPFGRLKQETKSTRRRDRFFTSLGKCVVMGPLAKSASGKCISSSLSLTRSHRSYSSPKMGTGILQNILACRPCLTIECVVMRLGVHCKERSDNVQLFALSALSSQLIYLPSLKLGINIALRYFCLLDRI